MTSQESASRIVRATSLPIPREEGIARVEAAPYMQLPPCEHGGCLMIAKLVWTWALENGCTIVEVVQGQHKHRFDVITLVKKGELVANNQLFKKKVPNRWYEKCHARTGSYQDTMKNYVPVSTSFLSTGQRKESSHV